MGRMVTLKNGETKPIIDFDDVVEIVRNNLGDDVADAINTEIDEWSYDVSSYSDMYDDVSGQCQNYCDTIFRTQIEIGNIIEMLKRPDTVDVMKNIPECIAKLTEIKELLEET